MSTTNVATGRVYTPHATARMESLAGLPLASFWSRAAAYLLDMGVVLIAWFPVTFLILRLVHRGETNPRIDLNWDFHEPSNIVFALLYFGLALYFGNGRTPGKRLLRIRVVSLVHDRITFWQAMERALGYRASILGTSPIPTAAASTTALRRRSLSKRRVRPFTPSARGFHRAP